jgi:hypothetical protein
MLDRYENPSRLARFPRANLALSGSGGLLQSGASPGLSGSGGRSFASCARCDFQHWTTGKEGNIVPATSVEEERIQIKIDSNQLTQYRPRKTQQESKRKKPKKMSPPSKSDNIYQYHALMMAQIVDINDDNDTRSKRKLAEKMQQGKTIIAQNLTTIEKDMTQTNTINGQRRVYIHDQINVHTDKIETHATIQSSFSEHPLPDQEPLLDRPFIERAVVARKLDEQYLKKKLKSDTDTERARYRQHVK